MSSIKLILLVSSSCLIASGVWGADLKNSVTINPDDFEMFTFENQIDHFNVRDRRTFQQRYWVNTQYWPSDGSGPNLIYLCGEYACSVNEQRLYPFMVGAQNHARLFILEHRFYGQSQPFDDWSLESLRYLDTQQALADIADFLSVMNEDNIKRPTILVGGSYPGALAAWFKTKYPHLAVAAWASSAVVQPITDYWEYDEQIYLSTLESGEWCPRNIQILSHWLTEESAKRLNGMKNVIDEVVNGTPAEGMRTDDFVAFYADIVAGFVQYGKRTILCDQIKQWTSQGLSRKETFLELIAFNSEMNNDDKPELYDTRPGSKLLSEEVDFEYDMRQWMYQVCTELGGFQTPSPLHPMRSLLQGLDYWNAYCERVFEGLEMHEQQPSVKSTSNSYGGYNIAGTDIFFANGSEDPWRWATQRKNRPWLNQITHTTECTNCAHCVDLYNPKQSDPEELGKTRIQIEKWIKERLDSVQTPSNFINQDRPHEFAFLLE